MEYEYSLTNKMVHNKTRVWTTEDFIYSGDTIDGLSPQGKETLTRNKGHLVVVGTSSDGTPIKEIKAGAFIDLGISTVRFKDSEQLRYIETAAFAGNRIKHVDFSNLPHLEVIGQEAFYNSNLSVLDFSSNHSLGYIGTGAFEKSKLEYIELPQDAPHNEFSTGFSHNLSKL